MYVLNLLLILSVASFSLLTSDRCLFLRELAKMVKPDIHTLAHHLKQERLYTASEKQLIQRLNGEVLKTAERLYRAAWIAKQQRINLDRLILTRSIIMIELSFTLEYPSQTTHSRTPRNSCI